MIKKSSLIKTFFVIFFFANLLLIVGGIYIASLFNPLNSDQTAEKQFVIPKGQSISKIGTRLKEEGFIKSDLIFKLVVKKEKLENKIQAGSFKLSPSMNLLEIAHSLTTGTEDAWVTIQEGWRKEEIAESIVRQGFEFFDKDEFLKLAKDDEGRLFPDTYLVPQQITAKQFYNLLINTFDKKISELEDDIDNSGKTLDEIIIMASLVEREGRGYENLRTVSGILWNRIEIGMALQVDATLQYSKGYSSIYKTWWGEPTAQDKEVDSPYNTYQNAGLPPGPISNPGLDALEATINPIQSDYLYYIHDKSGQGHYATSYDGHLENINNYLR
ncbi:MAG: endolytic transglycosylase MltG [Candidatus Pacebacteria bacterium]|nr:endolytic transglycosylase MltG [Candidatus Paceibacterota bacterium]